MKLWIYCPNCEATRPLFEETWPALEPDQWADLTCAFCRFVIATVSAGDDEGNPPVSTAASQPPAIAQPVCPHCGERNQFPGLDTVLAYRCQSCGEYIDGLPDEGAKVQ